MPSNCHGFVCMYMCTKLMATPVAGNTVCDSIWHVSSRSGEANCCEVLYSVYSNLSLLMIAQIFYSVHSPTDRQTDKVTDATDRPTYAIRIEVRPTALPRPHALDYVAVRSLGRATPHSSAC